MGERILVGVDGGGTHTVAVAARPDGTVIGCARGEGINFHTIGIARAQSHLAALLARLPMVAPDGNVRICIGLSALDGPAGEETTRQFAGNAFDPGKLDLQSDAYIALMGLTQGDAGLIIICGTGSMLVAMDELGGQHALGGWGYVLGDKGSSHALALEALRAAIDGWEGVGKPTALMEAALRHFQIKTPRALIDRIYAPESTPANIAQFARAVLALEATDSVARRIVAGQMRHVAKQAARLMADHPGVRLVGLHGGVFFHHPRARALLTRSLLALTPDAAVVTPSFPPELGALIHLFRMQGTATEALLTNMQNSYRLLQQQMGGTTA